MVINVLGSTGLVGLEIVRQLLADQRVTQVIAYARRELPLRDPRLRVMVVDFDHLEDWARGIRGDVLISALGTTRKAAGDKRAQYEVDYTYQFHVAQAAAANGVPGIVLISSVNADPKSPFFYLRMKGELEESTCRLPFASIAILRPGPLKGQREKFRIGEALAAVLLDLMPKVLVTPGARPIDAETVAASAVAAALRPSPGIRIIGPRELLQSSYSP